MRHLKHLLALLCVLLASQAAWAQSDGGSVGSVSWNYWTSGKLSITGSGSMKASTAQTSSTTYGFDKYKGSITTIEIGDNITEISPYAFDGFTALTTVTWGPALKTIGAGAFQNCTGLKGDFDLGSITTMGDYAFSGTNITSVTIPSGVTTIPANAFTGCTKLTSVKGCSGVQTIGTYAFYNTGLTSFTIPSKVTSLGGGVLGKTPNLTTITSSSTSFTVASGVLYDKDKTSIIASVSTITSLDIPKTVTYIGSYSFQNRKQLTSVTGGYKLTSMGYSVFDGCDKMKYIFINQPSSISLMANSGNSNTFAGLPSTCRIYIPNATTISNVKNTDATVINNRLGTSSVCWYIDNATLYLLPISSATGAVAMPNATSSALWEYSKYSSEIKKVKPDLMINVSGTYCRLNSIGAYAFYNMSDLVSLNCYNMDEVTKIGNYAFANTGLNTISESSIYAGKVSTIGSYAFYNTKFTTLSLTSFTALKTIESNAFRSVPLTSISLPSTVESIGIGAFQSTKLETFAIPSSLKTLSDGRGSALWGTTTLKSITGGSTVYTVKGNGVYKNTTLVQGCKNTVIQSNTTELTANCLANMGLTTITIPNSVTSISGLGDNTFSYIYDNRTSAANVDPSTYQVSDKTTVKVFVLNSDIRTKYVNAGYTAANVMVTSCGDKATWKFDPATGTLSIMGSGAIKASGSGNFPWNAVMSQIKTLKIEAAITTIPAYAFYNATNLSSTDVSVNDEVTSIGDYAFSNTALTSYAFQNTLTSIGNYAFQNTKLTSVTIPKSVTSLSVNAFANVQTLATISVEAGNTYYKSQNNALLNYAGTTLYVLAKNATEIPSSVTTIAANALCHGKTTVTIPASVTTYNSNWAANASQITKLTVLSENKPGSFGNLNTSSCEVHIGSPVQSTANTIYNNWSSFSKKVYDYCGTNLTWSVSSNKLTITKVDEAGSDGVMWNFTSSSTAATLPWYSNKSTLTSVVINNGVTTIGNSAFQNCGNITSVTIPNSVTMIGTAAFSGTGLKSVTLPAALTSIGEAAFQSTAITSITIPATVTVIGTWGPNSIQTVKVDAANTKFTSQDKSGKELNMLMSKDNKSLYLCPSTTESVALPTGMTTVNSGSFNGAVGKLTIPSTVTSMQSWPTSATSIHASNEPTSYVAVPSSLKSVKVYASSATVQTKYKGLGFTNVVVGTSCGEKASYFFENGVLTIVGSGAVSSAPWLSDANIGAAKIKRVVVENGITQVTAAGAFKDCSNMTSVKLPEGLNKLEGTSFNGCSSLKSVTLPSALNSTGNYGSAFAFDNTGVESVKVNGSYVSTDKNGNEANVIVVKSDNALRYSVSPNILPNIATVTYHCIKAQSVTDFNIPASVTAINANSFSNLTIKNIYSASTATIPATAFSATDKTKAKVYVASDAIKAKFVAAGFTEANIKVATGQCGADMYYYVNGKKLIIFGGGDMYESGLTWAGGATAANAFTSIQFVGNAINTIGKNAFSACTAVKGEIVIPASVTKIGAGAFGSTLITSVVANGQKPASMAATGFTADVYAKASLVVPNDSRDSYLEATGWENFGGVQTNEEVANPYDLNKDGRVNGTDVNFLKGKF